jgi:hypothetical protein
MDWDGLKETIHKKLYVAAEPFEHGRISYAYYCKDHLEADRARWLCLKDPEVQNPNDYMEIELRKHIIARVLAERFNAALSKTFGPEYSLYFCDIGKVKYRGKWYLIQGFLEGKFEKYSNNDAYANSTAELHAAFSHFTWEDTDEQFLVNDLQGVNKCLTDPAITSIQNLFKKKDRTNLGGQGCNNFMKHHQCNRFCQALQLRRDWDQSLKDHFANNIGPIALESYDPAAKFRRCDERLCCRNAWGSSDGKCQRCKSLLEKEKLGPQQSEPQKRKEGEPPMLEVAANDRTCTPCSLI